MSELSTKLNSNIPLTSGFHVLVLNSSQVHSSYKVSSSIQQVKTMANLIENPVKNIETVHQYLNSHHQRRTVIAKCLVLFFIILSYIMIGGFLFQYLEGDSEKVAKCGKSLTDS